MNYGTIEEGVALGCRVPVAKTGLSTEVDGVIGHRSVPLPQLMSPPVASEPRETGPKTLQSSAK